MRCSSGSPRGNPAYGRLVAMPGLRAWIAMDRATGQIISVTFKGSA
jgi:hypothetical protein